MTEKNKELIQRMRSIAQASMGPDAVRVPPGIQALIDGADALEAALAQQPQGEAVAWILEWSDGVKSVTIQDPKEVYNAPPKTITPLYAAPAPASSAPDGQFLRDIILECAPVVGLKADEASAEEVLHLLRRKAEASASPAALTDAQVIARAEQAGFKWLPPDEEEGGFPGGFDMSDIDNMRKLLAASPAEGKNAVTEEMVSRFLGWRLPNDFAPDCGISFTPVRHYTGEIVSWPVGTNLLTAIQARQMLEHVLAAPSASDTMVYYGGSKEPMPIAFEGASPAALTETAGITKAEVLRVGVEVGLIDRVMDGGDYFTFADHEVMTPRLIKLIEAFRAAPAPSASPAALTDAARRLMLAADDVDLGRSIHNERKPDDKIDGPVWDELRRASAAVRALLAASPAAQEEDARDVAPLGEMVCGDVESTIDGYEVGDYELIYGKVLDDINVNHPGKVFTIYIDSAAISASREGV